MHQFQSFYSFLYAATTMKPHPSTSLNALAYYCGVSAWRTTHTLTHVHSTTFLVWGSLFMPVESANIWPVCLAHTWWVFILKESRLLAHFVNMDFSW